MTQLTQHSIDAGRETAPPQIDGRGNGGPWTSNLSYLLIGGGIGAGLALLFAPKSGTELRSDINDLAHRGYDGTLDLTNKVVDQSRDLCGTIKTKADELTARASKLGDKFKKDAADTVSDLANGGSELLENIADTGGKTKGSARSSQTGF